MVLVVRLLLLATLSLCFLPPASAAISYHRIKLFDGGASYHHSFRIPSIVKTNDALVAFAEGRVNNNSDWGDINIVYRRSTDDGETWGSTEFLCNAVAYAYGNPTAVFDPSRGSNGRLWVFFNRWSSELTSSGGPGHRKTFSMFSDNGGVTWSTPVDRTTELGGDTINFDAVGPGVGIRKTKAPNIGQLVIPATGRNFYSNDQGNTWHVKYLPANPSTSEGTIVECLDGDLLRNDRANRPVWEDNKRRFISYGLNSTSFQAPHPHSALLDPHCEGSTLRYNMDAPDRVIFLNSDSTVTRGKMKVRISYDDGISWQRSRWLYVDNPLGSPNYATPDAAASAGKGGYSSMAKTGDYHIAALVEINEDTGNSSTSHRSIDFHKFNLAWILNGQSEP